MFIDGTLKIRDEFYVAGEYWCDDGKLNISQN